MSFSPPPDWYLSKVNTAADDLAKSGKETFGYGKDTTQKGLDTLQQPLDYFSKILSGNRTEIESMLAPEKAQITESYDVANKSLETFAQRGGGTNEARAKSKFDEIGQITGLIQKARPQAASAVASIGQMLGNFGTQWAQMGQQDISKSASMMMQTFEDAMKQYNVNAERKQSMWLGIGKAAAGIITNLLAPGLGSAMSGGTSSGIGISGGG